jgi:hypothetical protein
VISALISLLSSLFAVTGKIFDWLYARDMVNAGRVQQQLDDLREQVKSAQIAVAAREAIRASTARNPSGVPDNDPFLRD